MSNTKFTEGPWILEYDKNRDWELSTDEEVITLGFADYSPDIHNAHLMAASPLLYKALEDLLRILAPPTINNVGLDPVVVRGLRALASARGE